MFQVFTPKDKLAEWFEFYAKVMELNVWTKTTVKEPKWDDANQKWTVKLERETDGKTETRQQAHDLSLVQESADSFQVHFIPGT